MESTTKPRLTDEDVAQLIRQGLGEDARVVESMEFTDGYFNAAHGVRLADGRDVVLKVAPAPGLKLLRYEVDLMRTEIEFFERAVEVGFPLPNVWYADPGTGFMIMDRLRGESLDTKKKEMSGAELLAVRRELGELSARLSRVVGPFFGYPRLSGRTQAEGWRDAFLAMIADILDDAAEMDRRLPRTVGEIRAAIERHGPALDAVTEPALVHFDLWDGNIFVLDGHVEGFIDGERALYGDPIAELVSLITFVPADEAAAVVDGFLGRELTADEEIRLCLYRCYLWLILLSEAPTRDYPPEFEAELHGWVTEKLVADLAQLDAAVVA